MHMAKRTLCKLLQAGAVIAALTGSAFAQMPMPGLSLHNDPAQLTPEEQEKQKAIDKAYRSSAAKIPDKKVTVDPWATVRPSQNPPAAAAKTK
jgi:hypothetical protein